MYFEGNTDPLELSEPSFSYEELKKNYGKPKSMLFELATVHLLRNLALKKIKLNNHFSKTM